MGRIDGSPESSAFIRPFNWDLLKEIRTYPYEYVLTRQFDYEFKQRD